MVTRGPSGSLCKIMNGDWERGEEGAMFVVLLLLLAHSG